MPHFKVIRTQVDMRRSKGTWSIPASVMQPTALKSKSTKTCYILELPAELRISIWDMVCEGNLVAMSSPEYLNTILHNRSTIGSRTTAGRKSSRNDVMIVNNIKADSQYMRGQLLNYKGAGSRGSSRTDSPYRRTNAGLLLTCKQISGEFAPSLYRCTTFAMNSPGCFRKLIRQEPHSGMSFKLPILHGLTSACNHANIRHLSIDIQAYGESSLMEVRFTSKKYYESWRILCQNAAQRLIKLETLVIYAHIPRTYPQLLTLERNWVQPILEFQHAPKLSKTMITLISYWPGYGNSDFETTEAFCEVLRRKVMGFDDASALHAIFEWKEKYPKSGHDGRPLKSAWKFMASSNGLDECNYSDCDVPKTVL